MEIIKINSLKEYKLSSIRSNKILLQKIKLIEPDYTKDPKNFLNLFLPIFIKTSFPDGSGKQYTINTYQFFDNTKVSAKFPETNKEMNRIIPFCNYSTAIISAFSSPLNDPIKVVFELHYEKISSETVEIYVSENVEGYSFSLSPLSVNLIRKKYPKTKIARSLSITRPTLNDFQFIHGAIDDYLMLGLTGLGENEANIFDYLIIDSITGNVITKRKKK